MVEGENNTTTRLFELALTNILQLVNACPRKRKPFLPLYCFFPLLPFLLWLIGSGFGCCPFRAVKLSGNRSLFPDRRHQPHNRGHQGGWKNWAPVTLHRRSDFRCPRLVIPRTKLQVGENELDVTKPALGSLKARCCCRRLPPLPPLCMSDPHCSL